MTLESKEHTSNLILDLFEVDSVVLRLTLRKQKFHGQSMGFPYSSSSSSGGPASQALQNNSSREFSLSVCYPSGAGYGN